MVDERSLKAETSPPFAARAIHTLHSCTCQGRSAEHSGKKGKLATVICSPSGAGHSLNFIGLSLKKKKKTQAGDLCPHPPHLRHGNSEACIANVADCVKPFV